MSLYIKPEEAQIIGQRLLEEPAFRNIFFMMGPFREIVSDILRSHSKKITPESFREAAQKSYEIIVYELDSPRNKIRRDSHFWQDISKLIGVKYDGWMTKEEGQRIIDDVINGQDSRQFHTLIRDMCSVRMYQILPTYDRDLLDEMAQVTELKYLENDYAKLKSVKNTGTLKRHIKKTVYNLFLKWQEARITEAFAHPSNGECGYAHLSMTIKKNKLEECYGKEWYAYTLKEPFRSYVEYYYQPYGARPSYRDVAKYNAAIATKLNELFLSLKEEKEMGMDFPASSPQVSYNKTAAADMVIEDRLSPELNALLATYRDLRTGQDDEREDENPEPPSNDIPGPEKSIDEEKTIARFLRSFKDVNPLYIEVLIRKYVFTDEETSSKTVGYDLYKLGLLDDDVLRGYAPDSEEGLALLGKKVDKLTQTARENFKKAIQNANCDEEDLRLFLSYLCRKYSEL